MTTIDEQRFQQITDRIRECADEMWFGSDGTKEPGLHRPERMDAIFMWFASASQNADVWFDCASTEFLAEVWSDLSYAAAECWNRAGRPDIEVWNGLVRGNIASAEPAEDTEDTEDGWCVPAILDNMSMISAKNSSPVLVLGLQIIYRALVRLIYSDNPEKLLF